MVKKYKGIPVSKGIVIGKAFKYLNEDLIPESRVITPEEISGELKKFRIAKTRAFSFLKKIKKKAENDFGPEESKIFQAHINMLKDPLLESEVKDLVKEERLNAEGAIRKAIKRIMDKFEAMDNDYFKQRIADIKDVGEHLLRALRGEMKSLQEIPKNAIVIAEDLSPTETALLDKNRLKGFILTKGGETSHTVILARGLMLPAVINVEGILEGVNDGETLILNALTGEVIVNPDQIMLDEYQERIDAYERKQKELLALKDKPARTRDGFTLQVASNIATDEELEAVHKVNSDGIGLFRTEFLYMNSSELPDEEKQYRVYRRVVEKMDRKPVIFRTLDIGGDKELPYLDLPEEMNPFLGWRAIRFCLDRKDIFKTQLRALLRASHYGNLKIMFPLVSSIDEVVQARKLYDQARKELKEEGKSFAEEIEVGIMVEVPAVALMADVFARYVDFFSIGTNDLIQYTVAVDRTSDRVARLHSPYHPSVLRLIKNVAEEAHKQGIWLGICGEAAGDELLLPVFVGMGIDELSMSSGSVLEIKERIRELNKKDCEEKAKTVFNLQTAEEVKEYLEQLSS